MCAGFSEPCCCCCCCSRPGPRRAGRVCPRRGAVSASSFPENNPKGPPPPRSVAALPGIRTNLRSRPRARRSRAGGGKGGCSASPGTSRAGRRTVS
ncbi:MAG: hypothetical protein BJ554DRAFT_7830 [Olpidium bornovanus]|uniref:Uncharacterized protein n=1 Tax=Olpidium bornovanus TaxID=278681 RepID=A0A8H7ZVX6_9FUNG|nr:MAG: hypothetical protein BJ554DRAFT_7830 [Olpidium bornovanus]